MLWQAQDASIFVEVGAGTGKVIERTIGHANDAIANERCTLCCSGLGMLDAAFPLQHCPAGIIVLRQLAEDGFEIYLPISQGAEATGTIDPILITAVHTRPPVWPELRIFDVECANTLVIKIEEFKIVHLLQNHVAWVVKDICTSMVFDNRKKPIKCGAVMQVFAGMQLIADVDARFVEHIKYRQPSPAQFSERLIDQP